MISSTRSKPKHEEDRVFPRPAPVFTQGATTLYAQFASVLRGRILGGEFAPGDLLPSIAQLCKTYNLGRITVSHGLQILADEGLITVERGRGTQVIHSPGERQTLPMFKSLTTMSYTDPEKYSVQLDTRLTGQSLPDNRWAVGEPFDSYVRIDKVDSDDGRPYCQSTVYVAEAISRKFPAGAEKKYKLFRLVQKYSSMPITGGKERFTVAAADIHEAEKLRIPMAAPVAHAIRVFTDERNRVVYYGISSYRGDLFGIELDLSEHFKP